MSAEKKKKNLVISVPPVARLSMSVHLLSTMEKKSCRNRAVINPWREGKLFLVKLAVITASQSFLYARFFTKVTRSLGVLQNSSLAFSSCSTPGNSGQKQRPWYLRSFLQYQDLFFCDARK